MTVATPSMDALTWFRRQVEAADADLLREMITTFAGTLMSAEADALCGAGHGERTPERVNSRNGYRERTWDTRTGTIDLAIPKLRSGSYFPDWLLEQRRRSERALVAVVAECYVRGGLVARGLRGVRLVISDAHEGLKNAIAAVLDGASWQRCRTHFMCNLLSRVPRSAQAVGSP
jgi:transposase-like protein